MGALDRLKAFLGDLPGGYEPINHIFPRLDRKQLLKELRPEELGKERGNQRQPDAAETALDSVEATITNCFDREKNTCHNLFLEHLSTFEQRLNFLSSWLHNAEVEMDAQEAIGDFEAEIRQIENDLILERRRVVDSDLHFKQFRESNGLLRPANYPSSKKGLIGFLLLLCVMEAVMNGYFLAIGDEFGLMGGVSQAFLISLLNVGVAFIAGRYALSRVSHTRTISKFFGAIFLVLYIAFAVSLNLAVAHYRDALVGGLDDATRQATERFMEHTFAIQDFKSWIMFGLACLFSFFALKEGYGFSDRYPGYEHEDRHHRKIHEEYAEKVDEGIERLRGIRDEAAEAIRSHRNDLEKRLQAVNGIIPHRQRFISQFVAHIDQLESDANEFLSLYRTANRNARSPEPAPAHFDEWWYMQRPEITLAEFPSISFDELAENVKKTDAALESAINGFSTAFREALPRLKSIAELTT